MQPRFEFDPDPSRPRSRPLGMPRRGGPSHPAADARAAAGRGQVLDPFSTIEPFADPRGYEVAESLEELHYRLEGRRLRIAFLSRMGAPRSLIERERMEADRIDATIRLRIRAVQVRRNLDERLLLEEAVEAWEELAADADTGSHHDRSDLESGMGRGSVPDGLPAEGDLGPIDELAFDPASGGCARAPGGSRVSGSGASGSGASGGGLERSGRGIAKEPGGAGARLQPSRLELEELLASDRLMGQVVTERIQVLALDGVSQRLATTA